MWLGSNPQPLRQESDALTTVPHYMQLVAMLKSVKNKNVCTV